LNKFDPFGFDYTIACPLRLFALPNQALGERAYIIGKDIPLPMTCWVDEPEKVGTDRVVSAAAAYDVVGDAVVVADFGTAVTINLVDQNGIFQGGVI